jgi:hypothetical protein
MSARPADLEKIKAIEWLCISPEHKGEAVLQANELLREFFLHPKTLQALVVAQRQAAPESAASSSSSSFVAGGGGGAEQVVKLPSQAVAKGHTWRFDAAELLVLSSSGIASEGGAFPDMVLQKMAHAVAAAAAGASDSTRRPRQQQQQQKMEDDDASAAVGSGLTTVSAAGGGLRTATVWGRVLKEQQCWRVLLRAVHAHREWKRALSLAAASHPAPWANPPTPQPGAPQDEHEDYMYRVQQQEVRRRQQTHAWLSDALDTVLGSKLPSAVEGLEALLDFGPSSDSGMRCYGPTREGERDYSGLVGDVLTLLPKAGVDPRGWMFFGRDYLRQDEDDDAEDDNDEEAGEGGEGGETLGVRAHHQQQRRADRLASTALRRECLPKVALLLHEVHHDTGLWLLKAAGAVAEAELQGGGGRQQQQVGAVVAELEAKAANAFRKAMQVADVVASRQLGVYGATSSSDLKRILKAVHASALQLLQLRGVISLDLE